MPSMMGISSSYRVHIWYGKTRMAGLQSGEGRMMIDSVVWAQYINMTHTHTQPRHDSNSRPNALHLGSNKTARKRGKSSLRCWAGQTMSCSSWHAFHHWLKQLKEYPLTETVKWERGKWASWNSQPRSINRDQRDAILEHDMHKCSGRMSATAVLSCVPADPRQDIS